VKNAVEAIIND